MSEVVHLLGGPGTVADAMFPPSKLTFGWSHRAGNALVSSAQKHSSFLWSSLLWWMCFHVCLMMDLGSDSGNLSGIGSISNLILMDLIREHSLTVGMYMSGTGSSISTMICFNHSWPKKYCFILTVSSIPSGRPNS